MAGNSAVMNTEATASIRRGSESGLLYQRDYSVTQRESLTDWTENDNLFWTDYVDRARRYFARRMSADFFERIEIRHVLRPVHSDSFTGGPRQDYADARINTLTPTLAWEYILLDDDAHSEWAGKIDEGAIVYDLEIYRENRLVYFADDIASTRHLVELELEPCTEYRWSVRPAFLIESTRRLGDWMINNPNRFADLGSTSSLDAPDRFPLAKTPCNSL